MSEELSTNFKRMADVNRINVLLETMEKLDKIRDLHSLLGCILSESRLFCNADAGSIYLEENGKLKFSFVQNDTIFQNDILSNKYIYSNSSIPIDEKSIAGYAASTGKPLIIDDVYSIEKEKPYTFNAYFDEISSYHTRSMLVMPLKTRDDKVRGVLQLINCKNEKNEVCSFQKEDIYFIGQFAFYATAAIQRAIMLRELILGQVRLSGLRDPIETQSHVQRVASYAVEIYQQWAYNHQVPRGEVDSYKDILFISSMLHDVGKVGIPDSILKKNGKLTDEEFSTMKQHCVYGAKLFEGKSSTWEHMAYEIILNHHEKWNGTGYPGKIGSITHETMQFGPGKKSGEIPLSARIVSIADVYDALINKRTYKDPWEEDKVLFYIKSETGKHFDPEIADIFMQIQPTIKAIAGKWDTL